MPLFGTLPEAASLLERASRRLLDAIPVDEAWIARVRTAAEQGPLVYVIRNDSLLDLIALDHLTRRHALPRIGFANEHGSMLEPLGSSPPWQNHAEPERLRKALGSGRSALLFMKRSPSVLDRAAPYAPARGKSEGDGLIRVLVELQRTMDRPVMMVPQTIVWTQRPQRIGFSFFDALFGPAEFPGELRMVAQFLANHKNCVVRAGEPFSVRELLDEEDGNDDQTIARRLVYALLRRAERERRSVLGPVQKPADRVREEVLKSSKLQAVIKDLAGPAPEQRTALERKARGMLQELAAAPDAQALKGFEIMADTLVDRVYAGIDVDREGLERIRDAARKGSVILLPSHKSHVDYILLSYVLRKNALPVPVIAAGDNLAFFPLGPVFRRAGAFFIRRTFKGDRLYTTVVDAYIRRLMRDGFAIELFLEGGRSRTGKLLSPKLGLLNMLVDAALSLDGRTVSFVPVSIGYERMMEEGAYARELSGAVKKKEDAAALLRVGEVLREKYGRANVQFGRIFELAELRSATGNGAMTPAKRRSIVTRLGHLVMSEINRATAVTPGSLVALALLCHGRRGISHHDLAIHCARLAKLVHHVGARTTPSLMRPGTGEIREACVREATLLYVRGGLVRQHVPGDTLTNAAKKRARLYTGDDVIYSVPDDQRLMLDFAKNIIVHLFVDRALVSVALLAPPGPPSSRAEVKERVQSLSRLFKLEFMFRADASFDEILDDTLRDMKALGELEIQGDRIGFGPGRDGLDGRGWITFYASVVRNFIESYRVAARAVRVLARSPLTEKELASRALRTGEQMFLAGEIERSEAVSQPTMQNAFAAFVDQGYLTKSSGKVALAESFDSEEAAQAIEGKVGAYLLRRAGESSV